MTSKHEDAPASSRRWLLAVAGLLIAIVAVVWWPGCRQYPEVSSPESLSLMKLLYSACNTKDPSRLARVEQGIEELNRAGKLTRAEQDAFSNIIAKARTGDWQAAENASFRFAQDQVRSW